MSSASGSQFVEYDSECYEVQAIRDRKILRGKKQYLIKWKGWEEISNTWEPIENLQTVLGLVKAFQKEYDSKKQQPNRKSSIGMSVELPKKTKLIEKDKEKEKEKEKEKRKNKINHSQSDVSRSQSEISSTSSKKSTREKKTNKKDKKDDKKEQKKSVAVNNSEIISEKSKTKQKQNQKQKDKQQESQKLKTVKDQRQKEREKPQQKVSSLKRNQSATSIKPTDLLQNSLLLKQSSKNIAEPQYGDTVEITRINYHMMVPSESPHQQGKLFYNVDRRNKQTKKPLTVVDIAAEDIMKKNPKLLVNYLQDCVMEVEYYSREYENYMNLKNGNGIEEQKGSEGIVRR